jgi:hypothetical protein
MPTMFLTVSGQYVSGMELSGSPDGTAVSFGVIEPHIISLAKPY